MCTWFKVWKVAPWFASKMFRWKVAWFWIKIVPIDICRSFSRKEENWTWVCLHTKRQPREPGIHPGWCQHGGSWLCLRPWKVMARPNGCPNHISPFAQRARPLPDPLLGEDQQVLRCQPLCLSGPCRVSVCNVKKSPTNPRFCPEDASRKDQYVHFHLPRCGFGQPRANWGQRDGQLDQYRRLRDQNGVGWQTTPDATTSSTSKWQWTIWAQVCFET